MQLPPSPQGLAFFQLVPGYVLTWSILDGSRAECSRKVTAAMVTAWEAAGIYWQQRAFINLKVASRELWTHRKLRQDGSAARWH